MAKRINEDKKDIVIIKKIISEVMKENPKSSKQEMLDDVVKRYHKKVGNGLSLNNYTAALKKKKLTDYII